MSFREYQREFQPPWLRDTYGARWAEALGAFKDEYSNRIKAGIVAHVPGLAPTDALDAVGRERGMPRSPVEDTPEYRERLRTAHALWRSAGTKDSLKALCLRFGYVVNVYDSVNADGPFNWSLESPSAVYILFRNAGDYWLPENTWGYPTGDGYYWGIAADDTWGSSSKYAETSFVRHLMRSWLPVWALFANAVAVFNCELWGCTTLDDSDDFSWGYDTAPAAVWGGTDGTTGKNIRINAWER